MTATVRLSTPGEVAAAIPYLMGYQPEDSLVGLGLKDGACNVTARADLADGIEGFATMLDAYRRAGITTVILAVYPGVQATAGRYPYADLVDEAVEMAVAAGMIVPDALLVDDGRFWSYICQDRDCCPITGRPIPVGTEFELTAITTGIAPRPGRQALADDLAPRDTLDGATMARAGGSMALTREAIGQSAWSPDTLASVVFTLAQIPLRDELWLEQDNGQLDGTELWREVACRAPAGFRAPGAFLYGWAHWRKGNGAIANIAADVALADDPSYSAAKLLLWALTDGVDPRTMPSLASGESRA